jgi:sulfate transport system substrate-binding protein
MFQVRKDNPKHIKDWNDLIRDDVQVVTPNPKTSGGARWNYLAAWGYAYKKNNNSDEAAKAFITKLYKQVQILDAGARGATTNFTTRGIGDVLITWENEALLVTHNPGGDKFEIITPSISILAEPAVAVVDKNAQKDGVEKIAHAYLEHLYSKEAQELIAKSYYRPADKEVAKSKSSLFPTIPMLNISDFGGWKKVTAEHFADGGIFDQIYTK